MEEKKASKIAFFKELYQLDEPDDETEDTAGIGEILEKSKRISRPQSSLPKQGVRAFGRTVSAPAPVEVAEDIPRPSAAAPTPRDQVSVEKDIMPSSEAIKEATKKAPKTAKGKRKRAQSLDVLPESQQVFKGLAFFFIPNDDIAPARRFRIIKTLERGALWVREWKAGITHVIVDKNLTYQDILTFLKISSVPPNMNVVAENYTVDCMRYQFVVNPKQVQYYLEGQQQAMLARKSDPVPPIIEPVSSKLEDKTEPPTHKASAAVHSADVSICSRSLKNDVLKSGNQVPKTDLVKRKGIQDALDEAIEEARAVKDLPLDLEEDEAQAPSGAGDESDEVHSDEEKKKPRPKKRSHDSSWQQKFSCMQKHDGADRTANPNARTIEILQQMADYYNRINDNWRTMAYRRVIAALRKEEQRIVTKEEAITIPFVGERLAAKIEEIVWTDRLRRLENTTLDSNDQVLQVFMNIYGVGFAQASAWINQGFRTIEDLKSKAHLTKNQLVGIDHYNDFLTRIPREEVELHDELVRKAIHEADDRIEVTIGGSYRRGAADCGDVDFIITKPDCSIDSLRAIIFETVIPRLKEDTYIKVALATSSKMDGSKWHGAAAIHGSLVWRRIDFLLVPYEEMGAALIYFTGNDIFNRSIRLLASKKGMRLNQHGLWRDVIRGKNRERITQGSLVESQSEKKIFEVLGVPWRPPEQRIC